jgi:hypothetical protein
MSQCLNCNSKLSCGCQKRLASDGKQVCSKCLAAYEQKVAEAKALRQQTTPRING